MSYQALYRKYRPKVFSEVYGQTQVVDTLQNIIETDNVTHAYLFSGPRGTGKTTLARIFAKALQCSDSHKPCGQCQSCLNAENGNHNDIIEMDGASNNGVDEIRELREKMKYAPTTSKYKIYIIDEVHMLTTGAFNALLKTLEEPPPHVIFMMATTELYKVPSTILSRCMRFELNELTQEQLVSSMQGITEKEHVEINEEALQFIATEAKGGSRDSLTLLEQVISFGRGQKITNAIAQEALGGMDEGDLMAFRTGLVSRDKAALFDVIDGVEKKGKKIDDFIEQVIQSIVKAEVPNTSEVSAIDPLMRGLRNYRFYRQGILAIKAELLQFIQSESRIDMIEAQLKSLRDGSVQPLIEATQTDVENSSVPDVEIDNILPQAVPEDIAIKETVRIVEEVKVQNEPAPVELEVYHEHQEVKEEAIPEIFEVHGMTTESTVGDVQVRNEIYQSVLKDAEMRAAMAEPVTLLKDEIAKEQAPKAQKSVFQEISVPSSEEAKHEVTVEAPQNLMRVLIEAALFPEQSPIKYVKRRWELIPSLPGNYFTMLLQDTEVRAATEDAFVISCYRESIKEELEKHDIRAALIDIVRTELKIEQPYIIVTENEWLKTRKLFVEQWKQGIIDEKTLEEYKEQERQDEGVVDGQIGFRIEIEEAVEDEPQSITDAKALFGDIVEVQE